MILVRGDKPTISNCNLLWSEKSIYPVLVFNEVISIEAAEGVNVDHDAGRFRK